MNDMVRIAVLAGVAWLLWLAFRPRIAFRIRIEGGKGRVTGGIAPTGLLLEVDELCGEQGIEGGWIQGIIRSDRVVLQFSRDFSAGAQQQLRNAWGLMHGSMLTGPRRRS